MNELEEMKRLADEIVAEGEAFCRRMNEGEAFCRRMKEHDHRMEREHREMMRMIDTAAGNYSRVNEQLNTIRHGH